MKIIWAGRVISGLIMVPFVMSAAMKLMQRPEVLDGMQKMGMPLTMVLPLGVVEALCVVLYLIPQTAVLGAVLLTGYMGGAILAHLVTGQSFLVPLLFGLVIWLGPYLREARLRDCFRCENKLSC